MEPIRTEDTTRQVRVRDFLAKLAEEKKYGEAKADTAKEKKGWKWPFGWSWTMRKSKQRDRILVFFLNIKGELESPMVVPLYYGNMVIIRNKVYEVDPRAFWIVKAGAKTYKLLIIKEIDRRPVSNLDYSEIRKRGDATDSDEFLIKAALKAQTTTLPPGMSKWIIGIGLVILLGVIVYFFTKGG
jgi:hypothetical protein